jgi:23S rRNA (uracil1939-C5)-methyltransferase
VLPFQRLQLTIEKMVYGGEGLGRADGEVVLTPFALPGETIEAEKVGARHHVQRAKLSSVLEASPDRTAAPCPVFGGCGGCHYQHAGYSAQLRFKRDILIESLRRLGKIEFAPEAVNLIGGPPYGYRNRAQFHFANGRLGYREMNSHKLVPIEGCPIAAPVIDAIAQKLSRLAGDSRWPRFLQSLEVFTDDVQIQWNVRETERPLAKHFFEWMADEFPGTVTGPLDYTVNDDVFRVSGDSFFQINRFLVNRLADLAIGDQKGNSAWDLYAGVGLLSLPLARLFANVHAVESGHGASVDLIANARRGQINLTVSQTNVEAWLESAETAPEFVIADPPRAGLGKIAVARLLSLRPQAIALIACDPATLARDLAALTAAYDIEKVTLVDLFPQTFHIETIVSLRLR